jgi:general secretion pathway protein D
VGRLFGNTRDQTDRTEIVLSITPRIVRAVQRPPASASEFGAGTEASFRRRPDNAVRVIVPTGGAVNVRSVAPGQSAVEGAATQAVPNAVSVPPSALPVTPQLGSPQSAPPQSAPLTPAPVPTPEPAPATQEIEIQPVAYPPGVTPPLPTR